MSQPTAHATGYGSAARALASERDIEYRVFGQVTGQLSQAMRPGAPFADLAAALHENTKLWIALTADLAHPDNALPEKLRAQLLSLAVFCRSHTARVLDGEAEPGVLVEINTAIMRGLRSRAQQPATG